MHARLLALTIALAGTAVTHAQERFESRTHGFSFQPPEGWSCYSSDGEGAGVLHQVAAYPPGTSGAPAILVQVGQWDGRTKPALIRDAAARSLEARADRPQVGRAERAVAGQQAPSLTCELRQSDGAVVQAECCYVVDASRGRVYSVTLTRAPGDDVAAAKLDAALASFTLIASDPADARLRLLAARCAADLPWARDWTEAAARARRDGRLVAVVFRHYSVFEVPDHLPSGALMDPDFADLLRARFVTLRLGKGDAAPLRDAARFGMSDHSWGSAILFVTAEGEVLRHTGVFEASHLHEVAREALASVPTVTAATPAGEEPEAAADRALRRGDLDLAERLLRDRESAQAHWLRARVLRQRRRGEEALAALAAATRAGPSPALAREIAADAAVLRLRMGQIQPALRALRALAEAPSEARGGEALFWLGAAAALGAGQLDGGGHWKRLVDRAPDDPWAWKAAANLLKIGGLVNGAEPVVWPEPEAFAEATTSRRPAQLDAREAERVGLAYLLATQRDDGSWDSPQEALSLLRVGYTQAVTSIAAASLIRFAHTERRGAEVRARVERALANVIAARRAGRLEVGAHSIWAHTFTLRLLARAARAKLGDPAEVAAELQALVDGVCRRQLDGGGWPYAATTTDTRGAGLASSFLTAGVLVTLCEAQEAGAKVPAATLAAGARFVEGMGDGDGSFRYAPDVKARSGDDRREAAGRSPLCAWALLRVAAARGEAPPPVDGLRRALALLLRDGPRIVSERGKDLCHTGPEGQASYYFFYDYGFAAQALRALPEAERAPIAQALQAEVLAAQREDGSFVDMPALGGPYGTAMALDALDALR